METCSQLLTLHSWQVPNTVPNISEWWETLDLDQEAALEVLPFPRTHHNLQPMCQGQKAPAANTHLPQKTWETLPMSLPSVKPFPLPD